MRNVGIKIAIILLITASSCKSKPEDLIDEDKMSLIIADLKTLEAKIDNFGVRNIDSSRVAYKHLEKSVLNSHGVDSTVYYNSYDFYLKDKKKLLQILEEAEKIIGEKLNQPAGNDKPLLIE